MATITRNKSAKVGSISSSELATQTVNAIPLLSDSLPVSQMGALTTRTDTTDGVITAAASGHGIGTADVVDLYWTGGSRQSVTVGTVSGTTIPISGGSGDVLPAEDADIRVAPTVTFVFPFDGDTAKAILVKSNQETTVDFRTAAASAWVTQVTAIADRLWFVDDEDNPIAGDDIAVIRCSNGSPTNAATVQISIGLDITS